MMHILFDTDILSTFAKVDAIQHLEALFPNAHLLITPEVYSELKVPKEYGYDFPDQIFNSDRFEFVQLTDKEIDEFKSNLLDVKTIHSGELEAITIAINEDTRSVPRTLKHWIMQWFMVSKYCISILF